MRIYGVHSVGEYKAAQTRLIENWINEHFVPGSVTWELSDPLHVTIKDASGDAMVMHLDQIDGHYVAD